MVAHIIPAYDGAGLSIPADPQISGGFGSGGIGLHADSANNLYYMAASPTSSNIRYIYRVHAMSEVGILYAGGNAARTPPYPDDIGWIESFTVAPDGTVFMGVFYDPVGTDGGGRIYSIKSGGALTHVAGASTFGNLDGAPMAATFFDDFGPLGYSGSTLYAQMTGGRIGSTEDIRKITPSVVTTIVSSSGGLPSFSTMRVAADSTVWEAGGPGGGGPPPIVLDKMIGDTPSVGRTFDFTNIEPTVNYGTGGASSATANRIGVIAVAPAYNGNIYVLMTVNSSSVTPAVEYRIYRFTPGDSVNHLVYAWGATEAGAPTGMAAGTDGSLYLLHFPGTLGYFRNTIQRITGVFTPLPTTPLMSTLTDTFPSLNASKWDLSGPGEVISGSLTLGDNVTGGFLTSDEVYIFDRAQLRLRSIGAGGAPIRVEDDNGDYAQVNISGGKIYLTWNIGGVFGQTDELFRAEYDAALHKFVRLIKSSNKIVGAVSPNGYEWGSGTDLAGYVLGETPVVAAGTFDAAKAILNGNLMATYDDFNILVAAPEEPPGPEFPPFEPPDIPGDSPNAPPSGSSTNTKPICKSVLDWVREFSSEVEQPIRITGPRRIEMVNTAAPLPTGWTNAESPQLYTSSSQALLSGEKILDKVLVLNANGQFVTNDMRILTSDWIMPEKLPVFNSGNALVKQVRYTFTPQTFSASVDFHLNNITADPGRKS